MDSKELNEIITASLPEKVLRSSDIPSLDLYLDQILTLVSDKTENSATSGELTKTMINNYSKDGLIKPVKGKKYTKEHIVQMLIIYYMKGILSISDIKRIFDGVYSDPEFGGSDLIASYDRFLDIRATEGELCGSMIEHLTEKTGLDPGKTDEFFIMLMSLVSVCDCLKSSALEMISRRYPQKESPEKVKEKKNKKSAEIVKDEDSE